MIRNMFWNRVWAGCGICIIGDQCWTGALTSPRLLALRGKSLKGKAREEIPRPGQLTQQQGLSSLSPHFCCQSFCFSSITHSQGPASQVTTLLNWCCCMERWSTDSAPPSQNVGRLNDSQEKKWLSLTAQPNHKLINSHLEAEFYPHMASVWYM